MKTAVFPSLKFVEHIFAKQQFVFCVWQRFVKMLLVNKPMIIMACNQHLFQTSTNAECDLPVQQSFIINVTRKKSTACLGQMCNKCFCADTLGIVKLICHHIATGKGLGWLWQHLNFSSYQWVYRRRRKWEVLAVCWHCKRTHCL